MVRLLHCSGERVGIVVRFTLSFSCLCKYMIRFLLFQVKCQTSISEGLASQLFEYIYIHKELLCETSLGFFARNWQHPPAFKEIRHDFSKPIGTRKLFFFSADFDISKQWLKQQHFLRPVFFSSIFVFIFRSTSELGLTLGSTNSNSFLDGCLKS